MPPACQGLCLPVQAEPDEEAEEASRKCRDVRTHKLGVGTSLSLRNCLYSLKRNIYIYTLFLIANIASLRGRDGVDDGLPWDAV